MIYHREPPKDLIRTLANSPANEPLFNKDYLTEEELYYPNMKTVYDNFSSYFNIPQNNFILTSGTEESLRITISSIKDKYRDYDINFYYESPSWGMPSPIMNSMNDYVCPLNYIMDGYEFTLNIPPSKYDSSINVIYVSNWFSNVLFHKNSFIGINSDDRKNNIYIVDDIYTLFAFHFPYRNCLNDKVIYIGSFSKAISPGYRLGYIVYDSIYNKYMQTYRPLYVNLLAAKMINSLINKDSKYIKILEKFNRMVRDCISQNEEFRKLGHLDTIHPNYLTFEKDGFLYNKYKDRLEPNKEFTISGKKFLRTGQRDLIDRIIYFGN